MGCIRFTCHLFSLCPEEIRPLSWSHWAIKFASSWGDKFSAWWKEQSPGDFKWCSFSDETSIGCFFMKGIFPTINHGCNGKKLCKCIFLDSQNIQTNLQGTSKFHGNFCTFRAPLSPIVSSARPWTSSKSCVRAVSVILRRQRFLFDKFFGADSLLNALWEKFAIPPFLGLTTCV